MNEFTQIYDVQGWTILSKKKVLFFKLFSNSCMVAKKGDVGQTIKVFRCDLTALKF